MPLLTVATVVAADRRVDTCVSANRRRQAAQHIAELITPLVGA